MEIFLRKLDKHDLPFLLEVRNDESTRTMLENNDVFSIEECETWFETNNPDWFIILNEQQDKVGYLRTNNKTEIGCDIHPAFRRNGYARAAYKKYLSEVTFANLWVFDDNYAKNLYLDLGFKPTGKNKTIRNRLYIEMEYKVPKVALILTGLARKVEEGYEHFWKHVIDNYDCDIYLHAWKTKPDEVTNNEDSDVVKKVYGDISKYLYIEPPFKFTEYREGLATPRNDESRPLYDFDIWSNFRSFPMFYSWQSTYQIVKESGVKYDWVIRSRYDIGGLLIRLENFDKNLVSTAKGHGNRFHDDNLHIMSQEFADKIYSTIFDDVVDYSRKIGLAENAENAFTNHLERIGLLEKTHRSDHIDFRVLREDKVWWL